MRQCLNVWKQKPGSVQGASQREHTAFSPKSLDLNPAIPPIIGSGSSPPLAIFCLVLSECHFFLAVCHLIKVFDLSDGLIFIDQIRVHATLEQGVHVQLVTTCRSMAQEVKNTFEPAHQLVEESIIVLVHFVDELVEIVLMAGAEVNEGLDCLILGLRRLLDVGKLR